MIVHLDEADDVRLDDYRRLNDQAARRRLEGDEFFIAEGFVSIDRVIDSGHQLRSVLVTPSRVDRIAASHPTLADGDCAVYVVERHVMADVVGFDLHRGVVASAKRRPIRSVDGVVRSGAKTIAVLEGLNDAENVGVLARTGRALGADALVLDPTCTDPYARRTVRVSMGEVLHLPVARSASWPDDLDLLDRHGVETWAMTPGADAHDLWDLTATGVPERLAIVLGAEGPGLTADALDRATRRVRIPIADAVDSLNVGHAAAIAFAVVAQARRRQRRPA